MKVIGDIKPLSGFSVEKIPGTDRALVRFYKNAAAFINEGYSGWKYDEYRLERPYTEQLETEIAANPTPYLSLAMRLDAELSVTINTCLKNEWLTEEDAEAVYSGLCDDLAIAKKLRVAQSKSALKAYLAAHPLTWTDGEQYSITKEKQDQLTATLVAAQADGEPPEWNTTGGQCRSWEVSELSALGVAIKNRVKALVKYQQAQEIAINAAATLEELDTVAVDYDTVEAGT